MNGGARTGENPIVTEGQEAQQHGIAPSVQSSSLEFEEAKRFLSEVFGREKRKWSREEDGLLADAVPIGRADAELVAEWFKLPLDHPVFDRRQAQWTQRKQELTTFLRDFQGELDKIRRFAPLFRVGVDGSGEKKEPARWREFFQWKNGGDVVLPASFSRLSREHQREYERDFETFAEATEAATR